jgi:hypothetical protein
MSCWCRVGIVVLTGVAVLVVVVFRQRQQWLLATPWMICPSDPTLLGNAKAPPAYRGALPVTGTEQDADHPMGG